MNIGFLLHDATRLLRREFETRMEPHGLSSAQWRLVVTLARCGPVPQARLAERLEITPISVSRLLERMERDDWIVRTPAPQDRRVQVVSLTAKSREAYDAVERVSEDILEAAMADIPAEAREIMERSVGTMVATLSAMMKDRETDGADRACAEGAVSGVSALAAAPEDGGPEDGGPDGRESIARSDDISADPVPEKNGKTDISQDLSRSCAAARRERSVGDDKKNTSGNGDKDA